MKTNRSKKSRKRLKKPAAFVILLAILMFCVGCTTVLNGDFCDLYQPIYPDYEKDTPETIRQVDVKHVRFSTRRKNQNGFWLIFAVFAMISSICLIALSRANFAPLLSSGERVRITSLFNVTVGNSGARPSSNRRAFRTSIVSGSRFLFKAATSFFAQQSPHFSGDAHFSSV